MLRNRRYFGEHSWDARQYKKDAKTGKRRSRMRGAEKVRVALRAELRIVPVELEQAVTERLRMLRERYDAANPKRRAGSTFSAYSKRHLLTGLLKCGSCGARMVVATSVKRKPSGVYRASWFHCPVARTKGPTVCDHRKRYRTDKIEARLTNRAAEAMRRRTVAALVERVNESLRRFAARADGREDELRDDLAEAERERDRLVEAIASGGDTFAAVRDRLTAAEERVATTTAELERARFEKRAAATPTAIPVRDVVRHLRGIRKLVRTRETAKAKAALTALLYGDLVLHPATDDQPARVTGGFDPARLVGMPVSIAGA